jgi:hypothetical protein
MRSCDPFDQHEVTEGRFLADNLPDQVVQHFVVCSFEESLRIQARSATVQGSHAVRSRVG